MRAVLRRDYDGQNCSIARALEVVGERWTLLIVRDVFLGRRRFDQLQANFRASVQTSQYGYGYGRSPNLFDYLFGIQ